MASTKARRFNPFAFTPWPVTVFTSIVYLALLVPLIIIQHVVPSAPKENPTGIDLSEAWRDLQHLTGGFRPYNSRRNDEVHQWLLQRIDAILADARVLHPVSRNVPDVFVFDDSQSNLTYSNAGRIGATIVGVYFEGTNILVYIRGAEDDPEEWWNDPGREPAGQGGVLVNAHYDSVSTGFGATDDGVGVVTLLQLLRYFTTPGNAPQKGLVLLFNNGEEDFLNGAHVYSQHPLSKFAHTFLNLEGAGAGGRAALFRTTDAEVTRFYKKAKHPFGSVLAADGFKLGLLRSQTDYIVFNGILGLRGLDVAFIGPRARYHTDQDDARHTSINSLWHMLSAALATTEGMVSYTGTNFDGGTGNDQKVRSGTGHRGVWFDLFGRSFAVFRLHTLFALSVTLLIVCPLVLLATGLILCKVDRMYLFRISKRLEESEERVPLQGLRGLFRYPVILAVTSAVPVGLAYLITKINPYIVYSSEYAVWSVMTSALVFLAWFLFRVADFARPSALQRAYGFTWLFLIMWVFLVINTAYANQRGIAGGYFIFFYFTGTFLATWLSYLELFALPRQADYVTQIRRASGRRASSLSSRLLTPSADELGSEGNLNGAGISDEAEEGEEATESTSLLRGQQRTTFAHYTRTGDESVPDESESHEAARDERVFDHEQPWSGRLPTWIWLLQLILLAPIVIILVGQLAFFLTAAVHQVGADGVSVFIIYIGIAAFSILLLVPVSPFLHRFTYHVPTFLLFIFIGTLIYNLVAFPFSSANRLKLAFLQEVDLDTGSNMVSLTGVSPFVTDVIDFVPSAKGQRVSCSSDSFGGRHKCSWKGISPRVVERGPTALKKIPMSEWVSFNVSRTEGKNEARFKVSGRNTRACRLKFDSPISDFAVAGSAVDDRIPRTGPQGLGEIRLWSRTWENTWTVDVEWKDRTGMNNKFRGRGLSGRVICLWSDANQPGIIPALDEIRMYSPSWVGITKLADGLVEASHAFKI
jgi:hypothetical protein